MLPVKVGERIKEEGSVEEGCVVGMYGLDVDVEDDVDEWCGCAEKRKMQLIQADADQSLIWYANFYFSQGNLEFERRI